MKENIRRKIKEFMRSGPKKKARVKWEVTTKHPDEGSTGVKDPIITIDAIKINMLKKLISRDRQQWMQ